MTEAEDAVDDLNIKCESKDFCLYQLRMKTTVDLNISAEQNRLQNPVKDMMHENDSVFCEKSTDTTLTIKLLLALSCRSAWSEVTASFIHKIIMTNWNINRADASQMYCILIIYVFWYTLIFEVCELNDKISMYLA